MVPLIGAIRKIELCINQLSSLLEGECVGHHVCSGARRYLFHRLTLLPDLWLLAAGSYMYRFARAIHRRLWFEPEFGVSSFKTVQSKPGEPIALLLDTLHMQRVNICIQFNYSPTRQSQQSDARRALTRAFPFWASREHAICFTFVGTRIWPRLLVPVVAVSALSTFVRALSWTYAYFVSRINPKQVRVCLLIALWSILDSCTSRSSCIHCSIAPFIRSYWSHLHFKCTLGLVSLPIA